MALIRQTLLYEKGSKVRGNCLQAAVASLLDLPLDAVPHFMQFAWWDGALEFWARGRGQTVHHVQFDAPLAANFVRAVPGDRDMVLLGISPREIGHAIVRWADGSEWDPHPSNDGLASVDGALWFETWLSGGGCFACGQSMDGRNNTLHRHACPGVPEQ